MHHLTPRGPTDSICRKDHPCTESSASHFRLFPLTMGDRRWAPAGRAVPPFGAAIEPQRVSDEAHRSGRSGAATSSPQATAPFSTSRTCLVHRPRGCVLFWV